MKQATYADAESVASLLNLNKEMVWQIIRGMEYSTHNELAMAVHRALSVDGSNRSDGGHCHAGNPNLSGNGIGGDLHFAGGHSSGFKSHLPSFLCFAKIGSETE